MSRVDRRRRAIADSGIRIVARDGVRALTHRAVDREAGIPLGSTSYHAKTRSALLELIVDALADRTVDETLKAAVDLDAAADRLTPGDVAREIANLVEALAVRRDDMRARYALILELDDEPRLRERLTTGSEVHAIARRTVTSSLARAGLPVSYERVEEVIALTDSLVFHRAVGGAVSVEGVLAAYLRGVGVVAGPADRG
ncbi:TetR family transcriptional regulator [Tsukamurella sp. 8F]|uniref:TetR/AcrR family transcriptional regulator n=1 Tax=unclassified Tsukamurella TaxID=2633480 RepID=UPI0023B8FCFB|nr:MULTISPECIES: TetR/AcrR family transcriptional regulator [unclassified Tsukamurella]MDF0532170.1 TetR family transcriptional regulator [Tsukamurella sp. 8J]MDF0587981.1 TetR family transcriptional regulator [Tsukamurella sp. 8F]